MAKTPLSGNVTQGNKKAKKKKKEWACEWFADPLPRAGCPSLPKDRVGGKGKVAMMAMDGHGKTGNKWHRGDSVLKNPQTSPSLTGSSGVPILPACVCYRKKETPTRLFVFVVPERRRDTVIPSFVLFIESSSCRPASTSLPRIRTVAICHLPIRGHIPYKYVRPAFFLADFPTSHLSHWSACHRAVQSIHLLRTRQPPRCASP